MEKFRRSLWWLKRDLRLDDNPALHAALARSFEVAPVYILEPSVWRGPDASAMQLAAVLQALAGLHSSLLARGSHLLLMQGECLEAIAQLHELYPFEAIFACEETGNNITFQRDLALARWCKQRGIAFIELPQCGVVRAGNRDTRSATVAERLWHTEPLEAPAHIPGPPPFAPPLNQAAGLSHEPWHKARLALCASSPQVQWRHLQPVSEALGQACLSDFLNHRSAFYRGGISSPNRAFTAGSRLSPHIAFGTLSLRRIFHRTAARMDELEAEGTAQAKAWILGLEGFSHRLYWRDHFVQRLESEPAMEFAPLNAAYAALRYNDDSQLLERWLAGRTGFPLIDACMRCLAARGFINFRMRAMVVNVACFALHLDWRLLQYPLAQRFLDYEPGIHFSQIQMQAGIVGINQMRVYNPTKQLMDQDPKCQFVKQWLPELRRFHPADIAAGVALGDYPPPCVNAAANIAQMKAQITAIRRSPEAAKTTPDVLVKHGSRLRRGKSQQKVDDKATAEAQERQLVLPF